MANYYENENHLIVWPLVKEFAEKTDNFAGSVGLKARYDMTTNELMHAFVEMYQLDKEKSYRFVLNRADGEVDVPLNCTVKEAGLRDGDYLQVITA
nr:hypothetical protein [uncultured Bacillus sp.]